RQGLAQLDVMRLRVVGCVLVQDQLLLVVDCQVGLAVDEARGDRIDRRCTRSLNKEKSVFKEQIQL
ncbi:hypothetical protein, partial [Ralstonia solanacearum]|uniref:hypothetical protein n=1 Tax=Ralstonia solanacearum TaxID=305 RepID=UPI00234BB011